MAHAGNESNVGVVAGEVQCLRASRTPLRLQAPPPLPPSTRGLHLAALGSTQHGVASGSPQERAVLLAYFRSLQKSAGVPATAVTLLVYHVHLYDPSFSLAEAGSFFTTASGAVSSAALLLLDFAAFVDAFFSTACIRRSNFLQLVLVEAADGAAQAASDPLALFAFHPLTLAVLHAHDARVRQAFTRLCDHRTAAAVGAPLDVVAAHMRRCELVAPGGGGGGVRPSSGHSTPTVTEEELRMALHNSARAQRGAKAGGGGPRLQLAQFQEALCRLAYRCNTRICRSDPDAALAFVIDAVCGV